MSWLTNQKLQIKLMAGFGLVLILTLGVIAYGLMTAAHEAELTARLVERLYPARQAASDIPTWVRSADDDGAWMIMTTDPAQQAQLRKDYDHDLERVDAAVKKARELATTPEQLKALDEFDTFWRGKDGYVEANETAFTLKASNAAEARAMYVSIPFLPSLQAAQVYIDIVDRQIAEVTAVAVHEQEATQRLSILLASLAAVVGLAFAYWLSRSVSRSVNKVLVAATAIADGDLNQDVTADSKDEVGQMTAQFGQMVTYLKGIAEAATAVSVGDLSVAISAKSDRDVLGNAFVQMQGYLSETATAAEQIADGNLAVRVVPKSERDTLGNAFATMVDRLNETLGSTAETANHLTEARAQLAQAADQAAQATQEVARASQQVAEGTSQQASGAQQVSQSVTELTDAITEIARGARRQADAVDEATVLGTRVATGAQEMAASAAAAAGGAREAASTAGEGAQLVQKTVEGMNRIQHTVDAAASEVASLGERSQEIGKIVSVIQDIAAQTNLLALNAAIEAARAGDQGRGFAVVADEVRQLAERVARATREIAALIEGVQRGVDASVKAMQEGAHEVSNGTAAADEAGASLQRILAAATSVSTQIEQIAAGSQELRASGTEVAALLTEIRAVVEQNSAATEEMQASASGAGDQVSTIAAVAEENSAATEQLSASAEEMTAQVEELTASTHELGAMADQLRAQVAAFKLRGDGSGDARISSIEAGRRNRAA